MAEFDPHAFSLIVSLRRDGEAATRARLAKMTPAQIKQVADAQHVSIKTPGSSPAALIQGVIEGTQRRIANRVAAAGGNVDTSIRGIVASSIAAAPKTTMAAASGRQAGMKFAAIVAAAKAGNGNARLGVDGARPVVAAKSAGGGGGRRG